MANEKQLDVIDRKALLKTLDRYINPMPNESGYEFLRGIATAITEIEDATTVDAIVSPVKIGQVLWCNIPHSEFPLECRVYCICREERNGLVLNYFRCVVKGWFAKAFCFEDVGKTVFFTKEEALAKMDGGNEDV